MVFIICLPLCRELFFFLLPRRPRSQTYTRNDDTIRLFLVVMVLLLCRFCFGCEPEGFLRAILLPPDDPEKGEGGRRGRLWRGASPGLHRARPRTPRTPLSNFTTIRLFLLCLTHLVIAVLFFPCHSSHSARGPKGPRETASPSLRSPKKKPIPITISVVCRRW